MAQAQVLLRGEEFITKLLNGERDFSNIRLEPYFNLSGSDSFGILEEYLKKAQFEGSPVILDDADLRGLDADGLHLPYLQANRASFKQATMMEANLRSARFCNADFRYARLPQAVLDGADLQHADFRQADLNLARLSGAILTGADFAGTNLLFTDLRAASIRGIMNLEQARSVNTANFQFVSLGEKEKAIIRRELWAQEGKKRRLFGGTG